MKIKIDREMKIGLLQALKEGVLDTDTIPTLRERLIFPPKMIIIKESGEETIEMNDDTLFRHNN